MPVFFSVPVYQSVVCYLSWFINSDWRKREVASCISCSCPPPPLQKHWLLANEHEHSTGSSHQRPQLTELNRQIVWAHGFGNNEMLQRVGECWAVTTKILSHGRQSRWPSSSCEACEASERQQPVAETVAASTGKKLQISALFQS